MSTRRRSWCARRSRLHESFCGDGDMVAVWLLLLLLLPLGPRFPALQCLGVESAVLEVDLLEDVLGPVGAEVETARGAVDGRSGCRAASVRADVAPMEQAQQQPGHPEDRGDVRTCG